MTFRFIGSRIYPNARAQENGVMKQIAHLMVGLIFGFLLTALTFDVPSRAAQEVVEIQPVRVAERESRIKWWHEARFGMFIHWGLYAIPGRGEWVQWNEQIGVKEYAKLADQFQPSNFNAVAWSELAKSAGMKYVVLTARHHDGFCLFDDGANPFTSVNTAARRDFVAEYVKAVRKVGLRVGLYYSPLDWRFPGFFFPDLQRQSADAMREQYHRQIEELLTNYGKLDVLWFDGGEQDWLNFGGEWFIAGWRRHPQGQHYNGGFINNRADMPEDFHSREGDAAVGDFDDQHPWELCTTIAGAWGYEPNKLPQPLKHYIQLLVNVVGRDGNLLLNVGPRPDGQIDLPQAERLREIGAWLRRYGESIYATRGGPFLPSDYGVSTRRDKTIYVHVLKWPEGKLLLPAIPAKIVRASLLTGGEVSLTQIDGGIELFVPLAARKEMDTIIALQLDSPVNALQTVLWSR
jgi:alpha-L-fucosidase